MATNGTVNEPPGRDYAPYDPAAVEEELYRSWEERGYFKPRPSLEGKAPFVITMPPPNVTGALHVGHALTVSVEDALIRWHRMRGEPTLWVPGRDHAGIAGQLVVERQLAQAEGLTRHDLGREKFLERVWEWMRTYGSVIQTQHKRLGASADWDREAFTMDPGPALAVRTAFVRLYERGLIYKGNRLTNWCPRCRTVLSDLEVEHDEVQGTLTYFRYPLVGDDSSARFITVATTRPETILADTAIAVHPNDERYRSLVGRRAIVPHVKREIPIVADEAVDPAFGSGAVKVTPGHDPTDFEIGQRHNLPILNGMHPDGTMSEVAGAYAGLSTREAREGLVRELEREGLLVEQVPHVHAVGHCQRCRTVLEPLVTDQWYVSVKPLAERALEAVRDGRIRIIPERFNKDYFNWLENIRDWAISRQLWWGHRIPVWYCDDCDGVMVKVEDPTACSQCGGGRIRQDEDVLDTWFSSGLWPFSTLGWPEENEDLRAFYPTTVMETGYDILFFWVARMIMLGLEMVGDVPFRYVYLHGLVRVEREKMAKTRGNVQDPLDLIKEYGTDAVRLALVTGTTPGNDINLSRDQREYADARNFVNKLWNAGRFVRAQLDSLELPASVSAEALSLADRWIISRSQALCAEVSSNLEEFQLGLAATAVRDFIWGEYCDWYLEIAKIQLREGANQTQRAATLHTLVNVLQTVIRLLHPFAPFVTEAIFQSTWQSEDEPSIMIAGWPEPGARDLEAEEAFQGIRDLVVAVRRVRSEYNVRVRQRIGATIEAGERATLYRQQLGWIGALGWLAPLEVVEQLGEAPQQALSAVGGGVRAYLPLAGLFDLEREIERLERERAEVSALLDRSVKLLGSSFAERAPAEKVQEERERQTGRQERLALLEGQLSTLRSLQS